MIAIKNNGSYIIKLLINHFVSGIYSLILFAVFTVAFGGKYQFLSSVIAVPFYLYLVYSFMWEAGAKRAVGIYSDMNKKTDGFLVTIVGSAPYYLTTVLCAVLSFFTTNPEFPERTVDVAYNTLFFVNVFFTQCMYSGAFASIFGSIPNVSALLYLLSIVPGILVGGIAYNFGLKSFRLRTIFGIKYSEEKEKIKNNY